MKKHDLCFTTAALQTKDLTGNIHIGELYDVKFEY